MSEVKYIIGILFFLFIVVYLSVRREGWQPRRSYYNSGLKCKDFCAKIKNKNACLQFNDNKTTKCLNNKDMLVSPNCYLSQNNNCMTMV